MARKGDRACPHCGDQLTSKFIQSAAGRYLVDSMRRGKTVITTCPHCGTELDPKDVLSMGARESVAMRKTPYSVPPEKRPQPELKPCPWCGLMLLGWRDRRAHAKHCPQKPK